MHQRPRNALPLRPHRPLNMQAVAKRFAFALVKPLAASQGRTALLASRSTRCWLQ